MAAIHPLLLLLYGLLAVTLGVAAFEHFRISTAILVLALGGAVAGYGAVQTVRRAVKR